MFEIIVYFMNFSSNAHQIAVKSIRQTVYIIFFQSEKLTIFSICSLIIIISDNVSSMAFSLITVDIHGIHTHFHDRDLDFENVGFFFIETGQDKTEHFQQTCL